MFATATAINRGDLRFPRVISDDFGRPNSSHLGRTPVGWTPWSELRGSWATSNSRLYVPTNTTDPVAVVNARTADVDVRVDVASSGGDAVVLRATDANNYLRISNYYKRTVTRNTTTRYLWKAEYGQPASESYTVYEWFSNYGTNLLGDSLWHSHHPGIYDDYIASTGKQSIHQVWRWSDSGSTDISSGQNVMPSKAYHTHAVYDDSFTEPNLVRRHAHGPSDIQLSGWTRQRDTSAPSHTHSPTAWGTSTSSPHSSTLTHDHNGYGQHSHSLQDSSRTGETNTVVTSTSTTTTRRVYLEQIENGSATILNQWTVPSTSRLRVLAVGDQISVYTGAGEGTLRGTETVLFNMDATKHGVGRRRAGGSATSIDNFYLEWAA